MSHKASVILQFVVAFFTLLGGWYGYKESDNIQFFILVLLFALFWFVSGCITIRNSKKK